MSKIILEFDGQEELDDARVALDGYKWKLVSWDMHQKFREYLKYTELTEEQYAILETFKEYFNETLYEYNLKLD